MANSGVIVQQVNFNDFTLLNNFVNTLIEGAIILIWGAFLVQGPDGLQHHRGMLMAMISYKDQFTTRVTSLIDRLIEFKMLRIPVDRLSDIVLEPPEKDLVVMAQDQQVTPSIELVDVSFRHGDSENWVLRHVDLKIEAGESVVLIGPSGCGKTTLLNLIMHELEPTEGKILIGGLCSMSQIGLGHFRDMLGVVMQDDRLLAGSLGENISFFSNTHDERRVRECARLAGLAEVIEKMPMAYETIVSEARAPLSGGEKQRMYIARSLYKEPKILILDEAINQVDLDTAIKLSTTIAGLNMTRILVTHNEKLVELGGRPIFVNHRQWMPKALQALPGIAPFIQAQPAAAAVRSRRRPRTRRRGGHPPDLWQIARPEAGGLGCQRETGVRLIVMKTLMFVLAAFLAIVAYAVISRVRTLAAEAQANDDEPWPFYAKRPLSQPEQVLYHRLVGALPEHIVLAQVQLSRVMGVKKGSNVRGWLNRINRMSFDFVVCLKDSTVVAAIELDDRSHQASARVEADIKKARAASAAGIRLVRWNVKGLPDDKDIREAVEGEVSGPRGAHRAIVSATIPVDVPLGRLHSVRIDLNTVHSHGSKQPDARGI